MTEEAIRAFQSENGIEVSGEANEYTMNVLFSDDAVKNTQIEEDPTEKLEVVDSELPESALNSTPNVIKQAFSESPCRHRRYNELRG